MATTPLVGQPFELPGKRIVFYVAANCWRVFVLRSSDGEQCVIPTQEWQGGSQPVSVNPESGTFSVPFRGARVRHDRLGDGYITSVSQGDFEVCFERVGYRSFSRPADCHKFRFIPGIGRSRYRHEAGSALSQQLAASTADLSHCPGSSNVAKRMEQPVVRPRELALPPSIAASGRPPLSSATAPKRTFMYPLDALNPQTGTYSGPNRLRRLNSTDPPERDD